MRNCYEGSIFIPKPYNPTKTRVKVVYLSGKTKVKTFVSMSQASEHVNKRWVNPQVFIIIISIVEGKKGKSR